jgi:hypothetical protein
MQTFILVIIVSLISIIGLGIGYLVAGKELKGSCGGLGAMFGKCDLCENKDKCQKKDEPQEA